MPELYANDIEAIAKAAFEAHTGERWDEQREEGRCFWRDIVIIKVWQQYTAPRSTVAVQGQGIEEMLSSSATITVEEFNYAKAVLKAAANPDTPLPALPKPKSDTKPTKFKK